MWQSWGNQDFLFSFSCSNFGWSSTNAHYFSRSVIKGFSLSNVYQCIFCVNNASYSVSVSSRVLIHILRHFRRSSSKNIMSEVTMFLWVGARELNWLISSSKSIFLLLLMRRLEWFVKQMCISWTLLTIMDYTGTLIDLLW